MSTREPAGGVMPTGTVTLERYNAIDDYGRLINPVLTMGQVQGGLAQGIGQALLEDTVYDGQSGQLLSGSLTDYALPRADDLPPLDITLAELPTAEANRLRARYRCRSRETAPLGLIQPRSEPRLLTLIGHFTTPREPAQVCYSSPFFREIRGKHD
jgi:hypothetical protein